ncbi:MAG: tyrosine-type recombinase/integrase [Succinivibrio sp.]|nr:tyrosine-type recombinase/integrase [Succinivibrio sp.]
MTKEELDNFIEDTKKSTELSHGTLKNYRRTWRKFSLHLKQSGKTEFDEVDVVAYMDEKLGSHTSLVNLKSYDKDSFNALKALCRFMRGESLRKYKPLDYDKAFSGSLGVYFARHIQERFEFGQSDSTCQNIRYFLGTFSLFMLEHGIASIDDVTADDLKDFFTSQDWRHSTVCRVKSTLSTTFRAAFEDGVAKRDISRLIVREKVVQDATMPDTYSSAEIKATLSSIDRSTVIGKRDYAMLLCVGAFGWRVSDVVKLKLSDIHWSERRVEFEQQKTGVLLKTDLPVPVSNALIEYIKVRPKSDCPEVFLSLDRSCKSHSLEPSSISQTLGKYLRRAGIKDLDKRRHGAHSWRHSLASRMTENGTPIPVTKGVMGHSSTEVTYDYIRFDLEGLRHCVLPMPPCKAACYREKVDHD